MTITTITSQIMNNGVWVGSVPALAGIRFFSAREPAIASTGIINQKRARNMAMDCPIL
jgi:hypothetical protein